MVQTKHINCSGVKHGRLEMCCHQRVSSSSCTTRPGRLSCAQFTVFSIVRRHISSKRSFSSMISLIAVSSRNASGKRISVLPGFRATRYIYMLGFDVFFDIALCYVCNRCVTTTLHCFIFITLYFWRTLNEKFPAA